MSITNNGIVTNIGSGKTHTMIGNSSSGPGIMVLTMRDLFSKVADMKYDKTFNTCISYMEIYNESIRDLFAPESGSLNLCEDKSGVHVSGLTEKFPSSVEEVCF